MLSSISSFLGTFEDILWGYVGAPAILLLGLILTFKSRFFQLREFPSIFKTFFFYLLKKDEQTRGVHPIKAYFACVGGCVGVGNIVGICTAIQIGGPGALFWIWTTAIVGMIVKYSEVYLGVRYRVENGKGGYDGGPMYFLQQATKQPWLPIFVSLLLCIYGVEIYQFSVITESVSSNFHIPKILIAALLLVLVLFAGSGGVKRVGNISSTIIPIFVVLYMGMGIWVLVQSYDQIPGILSQVFQQAFSPTAATGGFVGSTILLTLSQGVRRGCYSADFGVGYASVIHSETGLNSAQKQASLVIVDVILDTFFICTMSVLLILTSGNWKEPMEAGLLVQKSLSAHFPLMEFFMPILLFLLGYSTLNAYFCVGLKCAEFISSKNGKTCFYVYSVIALGASVFVDTTQAQSIMQISGGLLLVINCWGIYKLRNELNYSLDHEREEALVSLAG